MQVNFRVRVRPRQAILIKSLNCKEVVQKELLAPCYFFFALDISLWLEVVLLLSIFANEHACIVFVRFLTPLVVVSDPFTKYIRKLFSLYQQFNGVGVWHVRVYHLVMVDLHDEVFAEGLMQQRIVYYELVEAWLQEPGKYIVTCIFFLLRCSFI